ncbi:MAG: signal peptidase I [Prevotellaceae bacterium]|nr:signal peptidase I [Prevotellaceae bacterium]
MKRFDINKIKRKLTSRRTWVGFLKNILFWIVVLIIALTVGISLRVFLLLSVTIPSSSMYPTLHPGDYVLVNKMIPGPRVFKDWSTWNVTNLTRLRGYRKVKRNDVLVFHFPYSTSDKIALDFNTFYAKRCVAVPRDTFYIENGFYKVKNLPDTIGYYPNQKKVSLRPTGSFDEGVFRCFPYHPAYNWNVKDFGTLYVPGRGDTVMIDTIRVAPYIKLIEYETGKQITMHDGAVYIDTVAIDKYVFEKNYYFMAGDYAEDSRDSRYWGLLPEDFIVGKAFFIWRAKDRNTGKWLWQRFFKTVK